MNREEVPSSSDPSEDESSSDDFDISSQTEFDNTNRQRCLEERYPGYAGLMLYYTSQARGYNYGDWILSINEDAGMLQMPQILVIGT
ncbi:hypothetical protein SBOR_7270 [Sclerotinia borealis F-4128]|uniref:Uncharacterized protein n=1 Tax=Sclerotinia borealis (strain F-4128) TaxID=1432307 RepID=W9CCW0_SCLBF|nr:hypothetical protein SBOR_7270 [Sclerotinia borealis F-4128]